VIVLAATTGHRAPRSRVTQPAFGRFEGTYEISVAKFEVMSRGRCDEFVRAS